MSVYTNRRLQTILGLASSLFIGSSAQEPPELQPQTQYAQTQPERASPQPLTIPDRVYQSIVRHLNYIKGQQAAGKLEGVSLAGVQLYLPQYRLWAHPDRDRNSMIRNTAVVFGYMKSDRSSLTELHGTAHEAPTEHGISRGCGEPEYLSEFDWSEFGGSETRSVVFYPDCHPIVRIDINEDPHGPYTLADETRISFTVPE